MLAKYKNIKSFKICGKSGQVKIDLGESIFQLLTWLGEQGSILSVHTGPRGGGRGPPRRLRFKNFACQNERIWTRRGGGAPP